MAHNTSIQLRSFCLTVNRKRPAGTINIRAVTEGDSLSISDNHETVHFQIFPRESQKIEAVAESLRQENRLQFITGAPSSRPGSVEEVNGSSALIDWDLQSNTITIRASLVGLPAMFYVNEDERFIVASDIFLLQDCAKTELRFDPKSVVELATIGYPIGGKTLFHNVKMLAAAHTLTIKSSGISTIRHWSLPEEGIENDWNTFVEAQADAFKEAMDDIECANSFLSLTAGLDTRAILAALMANGSAIPTYTMSGTTLALDARIAKRLCNAYGLSHTVVCLDESFNGNLPQYCREASRLSGGLASLGQAHEIYYYSKVASERTARLSGNLGNQVGRGGAENISLRNAGFATLSSELQPSADGADLQHWYAPYLRSGGQLAFDFLLEQEIPFSSVGNYCIGNFFARQQTPYASRTLIEVSANRPRTGEDTDQPSLLAMRLKDLHHRFVGESPKTSFQKRFIRDTGGPVAEIPINWGGKASGGVSPGGVCRGMTALADAILASKKIHDGPIYAAASLLGIAGVHEYRPCSKWLRRDLQEFTRDLFADASTHESGIFNRTALEKHANAFFKGRDELYTSVAFSLDLALAAKVFRAGL